LEKDWQALLKLTQNTRTIRQNQTMSNKLKDRVEAERVTKSTPAYIKDYLKYD